MPKAQLQRRELLQWLEASDRLRTLGFNLPPQALRCLHMFGARIPEGFSGDLVGSLRDENVFISQRGSSVRFAPHMHVTDADVDQLFAALDRVLA